MLSISIFACSLHLHKEEGRVGSDIIDEKRSIGTKGFRVEDPHLEFSNYFPAAVREMLVQVRSIIYKVFHM